jgi:TetR/AcrR family transcriptional repressor of nem operon
MRVSKAQQAKNGTRVVAAAARLMRRHGIDGVGVDALAKAAGMTHGAIYSRFPDKDTLTAAAIAHGLAQTAAQWREAAGAAGRPGSAEYFSELVRQYVSRQHRDRPDQGCAIAALAPEAGRHGHKVRRTLSDHIAGMIDELTVAGDGDDAEARRDAAMVAMSTMVGAVVLARAVDDAALSDRILLAVRRALMPPRPR